MPLSLAALLIAWVNPGAPSPTPDTQGPADACVAGFVWREAYPGDHVCVRPEVRAQTAEDNRQAKLRFEPGKGDVCRKGFVWREARPGDKVCVTPATREQVATDNREARSRWVGSAKEPPRAVVVTPPPGRGRKVNISCPVREVTAEITTRLPDEWWHTPQGGTLQSTAVEPIGGEATLMCIYQLNSFSLAVMRKPPEGVNDCTAVTGGFRCTGR